MTLGCSNAFSFNTLFAQVLQDLNRRGCEQQGAGRRFPAFVCHISCPPGMLDVTARPDKTAVQFTSWAPVLAAVRAAAMHAWHHYVPLGLLTEWRARASAPALSQPQRVAQATLESAAVAPQGLPKRTAVAGTSVWEGACTTSCGEAVAADEAVDGDGLRAHKHVRFALDEGAEADRIGPDLAIEQHAAASRQHRMHGGPEEGSPWLSAPDFTCGGGLPCADKLFAKPEMSQWHDRGMASCGLSCLPREERGSGRDRSVERGAEEAHMADCGGYGMHEADTANARQGLADWDLETFHGGDQFAQHATEATQLADCRLCSMQEADMTGAWGRVGSKERVSGLLDCLQSPASAAFEAQLPQSPTLDSPLEARAQTAAAATPLQRQQQLSFRIRRRPSEAPQLHPGLNFRAKALQEDWWYAQPEQDRLKSSLTVSDAETLQSAPGSVASPGMHNMAAALGDWMQTDDGVSRAAERECCSTQERDELGCSVLDALNHAEQQDHHRRDSSLHGDFGMEQSLGARSSRRQKPGCRRRASSAPPHHRSRMRAAHTNPLFSLRSFGGSRVAEHAVPDQLALSDVTSQANEGAVSEHETAQTSGHELSRKRRRHRMQTFSGVCSRPGFGASKMDPTQLCNGIPRAIQQRELLGDAAPVQTSASEASQAVGASLDVSGSAKKTLADQSAEAKDKDGEAVKVEGAALMQAPARRRRPQRAPNVNVVGYTSKANVLAYIEGSKNAEPVEVCRREVPPLQPGTDQVDSQAHCIRGQSDSSAVEGRLAPDLATREGNATGLDEKAAVGSTGEAVASSGESVAELLREWVNPACTSGQWQAPDLASLACGNLLGLVPTAFTKESLDAARPLRQVCSSTILLVFKHALHYCVICEPSCLLRQQGSLVQC